MRMFLSAMVLTAVAAGALNARAEEQAQDNRLAKIVAPYVDQQTIFALHTDLMAFEVPETIEAAAKLFAWPDDTRDWVKAQAAPIDVITQSLSSGSTVDIFLLGSLMDIARLPFYMVLPLDNTTPASAIAGEARRDIEKQWRRPIASEAVGNALVTGSPETIERLKKSPPAARPEIAAAFEAAADSPVKIAIVPPAEFRRLMEGIVPQLPGALGGGPTKAFTQGVVWAAVGIDLPPNEVAVRVVIQSASAEAAAELEREVGKLFEAIGQLEQVRDSTERFDELSKHLVPKAFGDQLKLELTEENGGIEALTTILGPIVRALYANVPMRPQAVRP
jgi:hypothetical protein